MIKVLMLLLLFSCSSSLNIKKGERLRTGKWYGSVYDSQKKWIDKSRNDKPIRIGKSKISEKCAECP